MNKLLFVLPFLLASLIVQQTPGAAALLSRQGQAVRKHQSLQYVFEMTYEQKGYSDGQGALKIKNETSVSFVSPDKVRLERKLDGRQDHIVVSDGQAIWIYRPTLKQYIKRAAVLGPAGALLGIVSDRGVIETAKVSGEAGIKVDGRERPAWVVESSGHRSSPADGRGQGDSALTLWIDKELEIPLQSLLSVKLDGTGLPFNRMEQRERIQNLKIDQRLPETLFIFNPPQDFKEVPALYNLELPWANLTGSNAPDFEVKTIDGENFSLASLKGKPVILAFWTSWCSPCRAAMNSLETMYRARRSEGLVVLGINAEEDRETVEAFLNSLSFSYPVAAEADSGLLSAFGITAYPTYVLIDPQGKIAAHTVGGLQ